MSEYKCIQRISYTKEDLIEQAYDSCPGGFHGGIIVQTTGVGSYTDDPQRSDFGVFTDFIDRMRKKGIKVQLGLSVTIGHNDLWSNGSVPYPTMVDDHQKAAKSVACPRSARFHAYLRELVRNYAALRPDVFWIDDDFRIPWHRPIAFGCFCADCIRRFNETYGFTFTADTLPEAIRRDGTENGLNIRKCWLDYNRDALTELVKIIEAAVHEVDDSIIIGFMQVNPEPNIYCCPDYHAFIQYAKNKDGAVWFRHGSSFYGDAKPYGIVEKNVSIARLCAMTEDGGNKVVNLTEEVTCPYTRRQKSMRITVMEAVMNIGVAGADGITDEAIKPNLSEQLMPDAIVAEMHRQYPYLSLLRQLTEGKTQIGIYPYFHPDLWVYNDAVEHLEQMDDLGSRNWFNLFYLGIPFTFRKEGARALLLSGKTVRAMKDEELHEWVGKGIYADGTSALEINRRLGENVMGVKPSSFGLENVGGFGLSEQFTEHPLNGIYAHYNRMNVECARFGSVCMELDGGAALSYSMNQKEALHGVIGTAVYENAYGGRMAVLDRGPWGDDILSRAKSEQIKNVMDWLCGGKMPVRVDSNLRIGQSVWESNDQCERVIFLYNTDFDDASGTTLTLDGGYTAEWLENDLTWKPLGHGCRFTLPVIPAWTSAIIRLRK